eukprot:7873820-Prorocentrum_lima.AAC.1
MTSSLVGSEMCIRDSLEVLHVLEALGEEGATDTMRPGNMSNTQGLSAVSYTHLTLPTICSV